MRIFTTVLPFLFDVFNFSYCSLTNIIFSRLILRSDVLKVPKRENFSLAFFTLSEPNWVCDLGTGPKIDVFIN
jgi:hypothetical protein